MRLDWLSLAFLASALVLPVFALVRRRLNWKKASGLAIAWIAIFVAVVTIVSISGH